MSESKSVVRRRVGGVLLVLLLAYALICVYLWANQTPIILKPIGQLESHPSRLGLPHQELLIPVSSSSPLPEVPAFWIPSLSPDAPVFLYLHGQEATIGKNLHHVERFHDDLKVHVLLIEYRGYGEAHGQQTPSEASIYEDAEAGLRYLVEQRQIDPKQIVIFGHSLGGAVAIELAQRHPEVAGLIVESTFTSVAEVSRQRYFGLLHLFPVDWLLEHRFDSIAKIPRLEIPVLFIHGKEDVKVPVTMSQRLFAAAPKRKEICLIDGAGHANCGLVGPVEYCQAIEKFLQSCGLQRKTQPPASPAQ